jgi:hypothetical protein
MERLVSVAETPPGCRRTAPRLTPTEGSGTFVAADSYYYYSNFLFDFKYNLQYYGI